MKTITSDQLKRRQEKCSQGKHKYRENHFGVVWCTNCGYLGNGDIATQPLEEDDKLLIIPNYCEDHET